MVRKLSLEANEEELKELKVLLQNHPDLRDQEQILSEWWNTAEQYDHQQAEKAFNLFLERKVLYE